MGRSRAVSGRTCEAVDLESRWADFQDAGEVVDLQDLAAPLCACRGCLDPARKTQLSGFQHRLGNGHLQRLAVAGYVFRVTPAGWRSPNKMASYIPAVRGRKIRYTTDGTDPFNSSTAADMGGRVNSVSARSVSRRALFPGKTGAAPRWSPAFP